MAIACPGERYKEGSFGSCPIGSNIQFKFLIKDEIKNQCSNDQVCPYKCLSCTSDQWETVDIVEGGGPSSLSEKFSNGTSIMDIEDVCFDDHDSDDEAESYLPKKPCEALCLCSFRNHTRLSDYEAFAFDAKLSDLAQSEIVRGFQILKSSPSMRGSLIGMPS
ncbi:hypothetical protein Adt_21275 [Abeliophyllum distichum]|uniref:Uncharacterized protein n=1 Tax=Abeliophyllum distichum TaxID=126358 RepID=A0ABD1SYY9_9LAMI